MPASGGCGCCRPVPGSIFSWRWMSPEIGTPTRAGQLRDQPCRRFYFSSLPIWITFIIVIVMLRSIFTGTCIASTAPTCEELAAATPAESFITRPPAQIYGRHPGYGFAGSEVGAAIGNFTYAAVATRTRPFGRAGAAGSPIHRKDIS